MGNDIKAEIRDLIRGNAGIVDQLKENNNPHNPNITASKQEAIVDALDVEKMAAPFITISGDTVNKTGQTHMVDAFVLIRCYNEKDKTFYTINDVLSRVIKLLNGKRFNVQGYATVETVWETMSAELLDQGVDMYYRELQFRVQLT